MKYSQKEIQINHNALDVYSIVLDIDKYPEYIPWCSDILILEKFDNQLIANMKVNYKLFSTQNFISNVFFNKKDLLIKTDYIEGPLKNLSTTWNFIQLKSKKCKVIFKVEFEFKKFMHQKLAEIFFPLVEEKMIESFIARANTTLD